jgi:hypothetical protein
MNKIYSSWKSILYEMNNFNCNIEFLQSKMRKLVFLKESIDLDKYIWEIKKLVTEHEHNLYLSQPNSLLKDVQFHKIYEQSDSNIQ